MAEYLDYEGLKAYHKVVEDLNKKNLKSIVLSENKLNVSSDDLIFSVGFDATAPINVSMKDNSIVYSLNEGAVNAGKVNGHTVGTDVPADAQFTDTKYDDTELRNKVKTLEENTFSITVTPNGATGGFIADKEASEVYNAFSLNKRVIYIIATDNGEVYRVQNILCIAYKGNVTDIIGDIYYYDSANPVLYTLEQTGYTVTITLKKINTVDISDSAVTSSKLSSELQNSLNSISDFVASKAQADGIASLDSNGKVPEEQLPSYVDDVIEGYLNDGKFYKEEAHTTELTGETGKIYVNLTDNQCYRYTGSSYVPVSDVPAETLRRIDNLESAVKDNKVIIGTLNKASDGTYSITVPSGMTNAEVLKAIQSNHAYIQYGTTSTQTKLYHLSSYDNGTSYISMWENTDADNKVLSSFEMQYDTTNNKFNVLKYTENSVASQGDVTTLQTNLTSLQNSVSSDNTALSNRVTALEKDGTIILTLTSYPSGAVELPAGVTVSDAKVKMMEGKAMLNYLNSAANVSIFYKFNSKQGDNYYFEAVSQYDMKSNTLQGISMGQAIVLEQNNSLVAKINTLSVATKSDITDAMVSTTWSDLKAKRDAGTLIAGQQYRITDYTCTTTQANTQSAGHQFDIIVTADSTSKLNEQARAIQHEGDTYFANSKLEAWKLWYSLDNDTNRFAWADSTNGKGVVYRMIDEWQNDCPYDFKNILYTIPEKEYHTDYYKSESKDDGFVWKHISNYDGEAISSTDISTAPTAADLYAKVTVTRPAYTNVYTFNADLGQNVDSSVDSNLKNGFLTQLNKIIFSANIDTSNLNYALPFNVFCIYPLTDSSNTNRLMTVENTIDVLATYNVFNHGAVKNTIGLLSYDNYFAGYSYQNVIGYNCHSNTFGEDCESNTFGYSCHSNTFGDKCDSNTFGDKCDSNTFGDSCYSNTFGDSCYSNTFGDSCYSNTFGDYCYSYTFGDKCDSNTFGDKCDSNTFGNGCYSNTFGDSCYSNTFGDYCYHNTFGDSCDYNTFGDSCDYNTFGSSDANNATNGCFKYNKFEANVRNIKLTNPTNNYVQYYHIKSGVTGEFTCKSNLNYETIIATNSNGQVVEYCEADLIAVPLTSATIDGNDTLTATGTYTYTLNPVPANATDIKSIVWSSNADATYGSINASTGVATVKQLPPVNASFTITATVTTTSGRTITATKNVTINKAS